MSKVNSTIFYFQIFFENLFPRFVNFCRRIFTIDSPSGSPMIEHHTKSIKAYSKYIKAIVNLLQAYAIKGDPWCMAHTRFIIWHIVIHQQTAKMGLNCVDGCSLRGLKHVQCSTVPKCHHIWKTFSDARADCI